jgi:hypothetical protein
MGNAVLRLAEELLLRHTERVKTHRRHTERSESLMAERAGRYSSYFLHQLQKHDYEGVCGFPDRLPVKIVYPGTDEREISSGAWR